MTTLPERLRALAESLVGDEWNHPLCSAQACLEAAKVIEAMNNQPELNDAEQLK